MNKVRVKCERVHADTDTHSHIHTKTQTHTHKRAHIRTHTRHTTHYTPHPHSPHTNQPRGTNAAFKAIRKRSEADFPQWHYIFLSSIETCCSSIVKVQSSHDLHAVLYWNKIHTKIFFCGCNPLAGESKHWGVS